ncbi:MAG TPA: hypothetical protein PLI68_04240 [Bacteroidia bacterium]|nr:hypothetical protein [Bacteroidia bacterium]HRH07542.1 hypothetical protein [Bacteroidia bacterium]HRH62517.1 hypothetical protein [Bacteroidia bacterium]
MNKTSTLKKAKLSTSKINNVNSESIPEPSAEIIEALLNYSKALSIVPSKTIKHIELLLN